MKILLCDDETDITNGLAMILGSPDISTVESNSARQAIELLKLESFDMIICDYLMPYDNGDLVMNYVIKNNLPTKFVFFSAHMEHHQIIHPDITIVPKPDFEVLIELANAMIPVAPGKL